ncbi:MAG: hypothetical protein AAFQ94_17380 [Bacteroidota bacterium]
MSNSETNRHTDGCESNCFSVDQLIDYAFNPDEQLKAQIEQCPTCLMILEGIQFEIESRKNAGEMVSSDLLKIQEQLKEDQLADLVKNDDYYTNVAEQAGLSITTENFIRQDIDQGETGQKSGSGKAMSFKLFPLNSLSMKIAAGLVILLVAANVIYYVSNQFDEDKSLSASEVELYKLKIPVSPDLKPSKKDMIEAKGYSDDASVWVEILDKKAKKERRITGQTNPFLLRITDKKTKSVLFQQAVSHPPKKLYGSQLKGEWSDSANYKIDYFIIRNMELIDSLKKKD